VTGGPENPLGPHLDDERLSGLLDGPAEASDAVHADACPQCATRLAGWRQARQLVAAAPGVAPEGRREAAIQAALAAFDTAEESGDSAPIDLTEVRRRRSRLPAATAAVAAAVILVAGLAFGLSRVHHHPAVSSAASGVAGTKTTSNPVLRSPQAGISNAATPLQGVEAGGTNGPATSSNMSALIQTLRSRPPAALAPSALSKRCAAPSAAAGVASNSSPESETTIEYAGIPSLVFVYETSHSHVVVVVDASTCAVVARGSF
jgi:hypothetical protein